MSAETHAEQDLKDLALWLKCDASELHLVIKDEPIAQFLPQIQEMLASYESFPAEAKRTARIERMLKRGEPARPVYVEEDDEHNFILEGRHRVVALYRMGREVVPVCRVRPPAPPRPIPRDR